MRDCSPYWASIASAVLTFPEPQGRCEAVMRPRLTASMVSLAAIRPCGDRFMWSYSIGLSTLCLRAVRLLSPCLKPGVLRRDRIKIAVPSLTRHMPTRREMVSSTQPLL